MKIKPFKVEEWMNEYEDDAVYNIAETCVDSISLDELLALTGIGRNAFLDDLASQRLTYGAIQALRLLKRESAADIVISSLKMYCQRMVRQGQII